MLEATGVEVLNNTAESEEGGGIKNYGQATITNCTISNNTASKQGGGIFNDNDGSSAGTLTLVGGMIRNNTSGHDGGGIYSDHVLTIEGGTNEDSVTITGNKSANRGGGVFIGADAVTTNIKGNIQMSSNTAVQGDDLYLRKNQKLTLTGAITGTNIVNIDMQELGIFTNDYGKHYTKEDGQQEIIEDNLPSKFFGASGGTNAAEWTAETVQATGQYEAMLTRGWKDLQAQINVAADSGDHAVVLDKDYTAGADDKSLAIPEGKTVIIDLNGHQLDRRLTAQASNDPLTAMSGSVLVACEGSTLTICDNSDKGDGKITGGWGWNGGGVLVSANAVLTLEGGAICDNNATYDGGGVCVSQGATLNLNGGTICDNKAGSDGGGVSAGATVRDNSATETGGGIYVSSTGSIQLKGATICGNTSDGTGGGLNVHLKDATGNYIEDCRITKNIAHSMGGGLRMYDAGKTLEIRRTDISHNSTHAGGGGVCVYKGSVVIYEGSVSNNSASNGGGVYVHRSGDDNATFTATNTSIVGNAASHDSGGGVLNYGIAALTDCVVTSNTSNQCGGGVSNGDLMRATSMTLDGCTISNNTGMEGGGIHSVGELNLRGTQEISANTAVAGGGINVRFGVANIQDKLVVAGNSASGYGNNLLLLEGQRLTLSGALSPESNICVDLEAGTGVLTNNYTTNGGDSDPTTYFTFAPGLNASVRKSGDDKGEVELNSEWASIKDEIETAKSGSTVTLQKDYAACSSDERIKIGSGKNVTVNLNGHTLNRNRVSLNSEGQVFEVFGTLTITDTSANKAGAIMCPYSFVKGNLS